METDTNDTRSLSDVESVEVNTGGQSMSESESNPVFVSGHDRAMWVQLWHLWLESSALARPGLAHNALNVVSPGTLARARNSGDSLLEWIWEQNGAVSLVLIFTFLIYGGLHLLAWRYQFQTRVEGVLWKAASIATASTGLVVVIVQAADNVPLRWPWEDQIETALTMLALLIVAVVVVARSFLIVECFKALPNSPASVYEIPRWTAYVPHI